MPAIQTRRPSNFQPQLGFLTAACPRSAPRRSEQCSICSTIGRADLSGEEFSSDIAEEPKCAKTVVARMAGVLIVSGYHADEYAGGTEQGRGLHRPKVCGLGDIAVCSERGIGAGVGDGNLLPGGCGSATGRRGVLYDSEVVKEFVVET